MKSSRHEIHSGSDSYEVERVQGNLLYLKGHYHPFKGIPTVEAIDAVNRIKRRIFTLSGEQMFSIIEPHLKPDITVFTAEMQKLLSALMSPRKAVAIARIFEYDQAYRVRLQDLFSESAKDNWRTPIREVFRLLAINKRKDLPVVHSKFRVFACVLMVLLLYPPFRSRFTLAMERADFTKLQLDEGDRYWASVRTDYRV